MYFSVDFPQWSNRYTCMYLVDFPQQRHTHTQTPRNINKFATVEAKDSGPERQMESEREREKKRGTKRRVQATYRYTLKASRTTTTKTATINNRRTKIWICFCFNFEKFRKIVFGLVCDIFNFHSFLSKRQKLTLGGAAARAALCTELNFLQFS